MGVPGEPDGWAKLGFTVTGGAFACGSVAFTAGERALAWGFDSLAADPGPLVVPTRTVPAPRPGGAAHPNDVDRVDHIVYAVSDLDAAITTIGDVLALEVRRRTRPRPGGPEMAFFRAGEAVIEVVAIGSGPLLWGVALRAADLDATVASVRACGGEIGDPSPAIQGGRIASVPTRIMGFPLAIMEPPLPTTTERP